MIDINETNFHSTIAGDKLSVIEFSADWCSPCKALKPILTKLSDEDDNINIAILNVDDNPNISIEYNIRNVPTTIFFKNGELLHKIVGNAPEFEFKKQINKFKV